MPLPHSILLEPNLATPPLKQALKNPQPVQRFGRVNTLETEDAPQTWESIQRALVEDIPVGSQENLQDKVDVLMQQVNALKLQFERREARLEQQATHVPPNRAAETSGSGTPRQPNLVCWNCDENGHRFMDCPKPQAILFCYRCGQKGFSLGNCATCRQRPGNVQAGNQ